MGASIINHQFLVQTEIEPPMFYEGSVSMFLKLYSRKRNGRFSNLKLILSDRAPFVVVMGRFLNLAFAAFLPTKSLEQATHAQPLVSSWMYICMSCSVFVFSALHFP